MITDDRLAELLGALNAAGDDWHGLAKGLPERTKVREGHWQGLAWVRPAVFLAAEHPHFPQTPVVLLRDEDGVWWHKGTRQGGITY